MFSFICIFSIPVFPRMAQQSNPPTYFQLPGQCTICWVHSLASTHIYFCFCFQQIIAFSPACSCLSLIMSLHVSFFCHLFIPLCSHRLSRAIHQHTFSCLAGAKFVDCTTCLTLQICLSFNFSGQLHSRQFIYVWVRICLNIFHSCVLFAIFPSQCAPISSAEQPWTTSQKEWLHYLGVQEQSKFPFVYRHTFLFVWPSSGSTHQSPPLKWKHTFTPQQWH